VRVARACRSLPFFYRPARCSMCCSVERDIGEHSRALSASNSSRELVVTRIIPTYFHVIRSASGAYSVSNAMITNQMSVLNAACE
jgi:hypothetical protein